MTDTSFTLRPDDEYIQLNDLLKVMNWSSSGGTAKQLIQQDLVQVNGEVENRIRRKLRKGDRIDFDQKWVVIA